MRLSRTGRLTLVPLFPAKRHTHPAPAEPATGGLRCHRHHSVTDGALIRLQPQPNALTSLTLARASCIPKTNVKGISFRAFSDSLCFP